MLHAVMSLLIVSFQLNFGRPLGRFPSIFISTTALMFSVSSLLLTWQNHSSLLLLITVAICSTFASYKISSFLRCSLRLTPIAHRTILISVVAIRLSSLTDIGHVSQPYSSVGRITVWYIRIFNFVGTFLSQITPLSSLHFDHAFATLFSTSLLAPPLLSVVRVNYFWDYFSVLVHAQHRSPTSDHITVPTRSPSASKSLVNYELQHQHCEATG